MVSVPDVMPACEPMPLGGFSKNPGQTFWDPLQRCASSKGSACEAPYLLVPRKNSSLQQSLCVRLQCDRRLWRRCGWNSGARSRSTCHGGHRCASRAERLRAPVQAATVHWPTYGKRFMSARSFIAVRIPPYCCPFDSEHNANFQCMPPIIKWAWPGRLRRPADRLWSLSHFARRFRG